MSAQGQGGCSFFARAGRAGSKPDVFTGRNILAVCQLYGHRGNSRLSVHGGLADFKASLAHDGNAKSRSIRLGAVGASRDSCRHCDLLQKTRNLLKSPAALKKAGLLFSKPDYDSRLPLIHQSHATLTAWSKPMQPGHRLCVHRRSGSLRILKSRRPNASPSGFA